MDIKKLIKLQNAIIRAHQKIKDVQNDNNNQTKTLKSEFDKEINSLNKTLEQLNKELSSFTKKEETDNQSKELELLKKTLDEVNNSLDRKINSIQLTPGKDGKDGLNGMPGKDGKPGRDGRDGKDGINGKDGVNGLSAYEIAVKQGFEGTEEEWINRITNSGGKSYTRQLTAINERINKLNEVPETVYATGADFGEFFEWYDGNPNNEDRTGYFVTLHEDTGKIKIANSEDDILGITTDSEAFIGNYGKDKTNNPKYAIVGLIGVVSVRECSNIKCSVGGYCMPNDLGIASGTDKLGYQVVKRVNEGYVQVMLNCGSDMIHRLSNSSVDLTGYATEKWVKDQEYMPIPDFHDFMNYFYYTKNDLYNKEEIDTKLEDFPTGGTELIGGDNTAIEDNAINVYTNTGYKVSDKDIQIQTIKDSGVSGITKMVYVDGKEIIILYDGTTKIRRSENGIDFETVDLPCVCTHLVYNADAERLYGTNSNNYFIYSNDYGLTWNVISNSKANGVTALAIGYGQGFRSLHRSTKEIIGWVFNESVGALSQNTRISSTIVPEFTAMINSTQFVWCNSTGTFKYGAGSNEGNFASLSGIAVNLLKRVNDITFLGSKNNNKMYSLEPASSITQYKWIAHELPDTCTLNDIVFNPYDETYYLFTDNVTYYKTKDFINFEPVDKDDLRGVQGYFTLMGIQMTTSNHNEIFLAPTRTKLENKLQEHDRDLNKSLWVGKGLELTEEGKVNVKTNSDTLGVSDYGIYIKQLDEYNLSEDIVEGVYVAKAIEKGLFDPYEVENWYYSEDAYPENNGYKAVKFVFTQDGSFYDQVTWETEFVVEKYEYGYLFYDASFTVFKYVKLGNLSWLLDSIIQ